MSGGTLRLDHPLALQLSTLGYGNYGGAISFGTLATATLGGLKGSQSLALSNTSSAAVALIVGNNGASTVYSGTLSGNGSLTKLGAGTLILSGTNTYTGDTRVVSGTLQLGGPNRIADTSNLVLAGGKFATGGLNETLNTLMVAANSSIDLGGSPSVLHFADSHTLGWSGTLTVLNWGGLWAQAAAGYSTSFSSGPIPRDSRPRS